jgi:activator of HSP90 ATPase
MNELRNLTKPANVSTRRQAIAGAALAFGSLTASSILRATTSQQAMKETPGTAANQSRTSLHQEIDLKATPQRLYEILLDSKQFAAFTGMPAEIDPKAGGALSIFGAMIGGRNIELVLGQRIVQAWRPADWTPGIYSLVKFELRPNGASSMLILDHTSFPQGGFDHLSLGWNEHYWTPLKKYLA